MPRDTAAAGVLAFLLVALLGLSACGGPVGPALEPDEWDFGTVPATAVLERRITVGNPGRRPVEVVFLSTCECLTVEPGRLELAGGGSQDVKLRYDPFEDEGEVRMQVIVRTGEGNSARRRMLPVYGRVLGGESRVEGVGQPEQAEPQTAVERPLFSFEYVYDPGCKGCEIFLVRQMIALQQEMGIRLRVVKRHIDEPGVQDSYLRLLDALGEEERAYPAVVFDGTVLQGDEEIEREFGELLRRRLERRAQGG